MNDKISSEEKMPELAEWERELLESQDAERRRADQRRLSLIFAVEATEISWIEAGFRVRLATTDGPKSLSALLDQAASMIFGPTSTDEENHK
jgi:hypothetical protein